jgi:hypothetical protein
MNADIPDIQDEVISLHDYVIDGACYPAASIIWNMMRSGRIYSQPVSNVPKQPPRRPKTKVAEATKEQPQNNTVPA